MGIRRCRSIYSNCFMDILIVSKGINFEQYQTQNENESCFHINSKNDRLHILLP